MSAGSLLFQLRLTGSHRLAKRTGRRLFAAIKRCVSDSDCSSATASTFRPLSEEESPAIDPRPTWDRMELAPPPRLEPMSFDAGKTTTVTWYLGVTTKDANPATMANRTVIAK